jgi:hypothetical protein
LYAVWRFNPPDTLMLSFGSGFSGVNIAVAGQRPQLRGDAFAWTDGGARVEGRATLTEAECRDAESLDRWLKVLRDTAP